MLFEVQKKSPRIAETNTGELMLLLKYAVCDSKKLRFIKKKRGNY